MPQNKVDILKKSPWLYIAMVVIWSVLAGFLWYSFARSFAHIPYQPGIEVTAVKKTLSLILLIFNAVFISYFWLNGVKDLIYVVWYYIKRPSFNRRYMEIINTDVSSVKNRVLMVYCTCNDFDGACLEKSMQQDYAHVQTVILDDSDKQEYKDAIDAFAAEHRLEVVRRKDRSGFKAGNINHYLMSDAVKGGKTYDYVVILDSDEILPPNYIHESLKYFYACKNIGIVQSNHISTRNRNFFMKLFHIGVNSHWPTYQIMKHFYGFSTMLGHGAMIKRECYEEVGGFPDLVAEDLCISIEMRNKGYYVAFAPNILCQEEYPIDYVAFKKRHSKWTQGNLEFIKKYTKKIISSPMKWHEKLDIVLFTYNLPLTAVFAFFIFSNLVFAPLLGIDLGNVYAMWMVIPTIIFFFSPMFNDMITWSFKLNPIRNIVYFINVIILYGSMLTTSLISAFLGMCGKKAKFIVTPKSSSKMTFWQACMQQRKEFAFSTFLLVMALIFSKSILPVLLIIVTGYSSVILLFFSNKKYTPEQTATIDRKTSEISMRLNQSFCYTEKIENQEKANANQFQNTREQKNKGVPAI